MTVIFLQARSKQPVQNLPLNCLFRNNDMKKTQCWAD
jgi:hypothetical protein